MFDSIRRKLLKKYMLIQYPLIIFIFVILYAVYIWTAMVNQREQVELLAYEEIDEYKYIFQGEGYHKNLAIERPESTYNNFFYAYNSANELIGANQPDAEIRTHLAKLIAEWEINDKEVLAEFTWRENKILPSMYMVTKRVLYDNQKLLGTVYAGKDITRNLYRVMRIFLFISLLIIIIMLLVYRMTLIMVDEAMEPIEQALERQKSFTADASHELRTPLSVMLASLDCLKRDKKSSLSDFSREIIGDMGLEINKMRSLVENLLLLARSDNRVANSEQEIVDVTELAARQCRNFKALAEKSQLNFVYKLQAENAMLLANGQQVSQLMGILIDNAIKYTPAGGSVAAQLVRSANQLIFSVADTGCGIESADLENIFKRFYRGDKARSFNGGSGLGLAIGKFFAESNNIYIEVTSKVGQGSTFRLIMAEYKI